MKEKLQKYLKVLRVELEDLEEDLKLMSDLYSQREEREEITDYVLNENLSLLKMEIAGIHKVVESIDEIAVEKYSSLDEMIDHIDSIFRERTRDAGFPDSVSELVKRKLLKVARYIQSGDE